MNIESRKTQDFRRFQIIVLIAIALFPLILLGVVTMSERETRMEQKLFHSQPHLIRR